MVSLRRRHLLGAGAAVLGAGGYWAYTQRGVDCPPVLEPTHEFYEEFMNVWSRPVFDSHLCFISGGTGIRSISPGERYVRLLALELNGEVKWGIRQELGGGFGEPHPTDESVYATSGGNVFFAVDRDTGEIDWKLDLGTPGSGYMSWLTLVYDDTVIASTHYPDHEEIDSSDALIGMSTEDGSLAWTTPLDGDVMTGIALVQGIVIVVTDQGTVNGVDPVTGALEWEASLGDGHGRMTRPTAFGEHVWIARDDGTLIGFDPRSGEDTVRTTVLEGDRGDTVIKDMLVLDDQLIVGDRQGTVTSLDDTGAKRWQHEGLERTAGLTTTQDRVAVLDQRGVYAELDTDTGEQQRAYLLADIQDADRCGHRPDERRYRGLGISRHTLITSGRITPMARFDMPR